MEDIKESMALQKSRAGVAGRFSAFAPIVQNEDHAAYEDNDHEAMRSSWVPPRSDTADTMNTTQRQLSMSRSTRSHSDRSNSINTINESRSSQDSVHSEAPDDIMFGIPLDDSVPPQSLVGSASSEESLVRQPSMPFHKTTEQGMADSLEQTRHSVLAVIPDALSHPEITPTYHDRTFTILYILSQASLFSSAFFIYLRTDVSNTPMVDSIYTVLRSSMTLIVKDIFLALVIAALWLLAVRTFVKSILYVVIIAVPIVTTSFSLYSLIWSYRGTTGGYEVQARAMRWSSLFMALFGAAWAHTAYRRRYAMNQAVAIIKLAFVVLENNIALLLSSIANLVVFVVYSLIWIQQFERIFLRGAFTGLGSTRTWIMEGNSWFMGVYFIMVYLWTFGIFSGVQRAAIAAVVSQWYFHRHALPAIPQDQIVKAAHVHALSTSFGTVCASSLYALLTRLPLLALPRRLSGLFSLAAYMLLSAPIISLTSPLTLSYASIHSIDIATAAKSINNHPSLNPASSWSSYRTAKMLLSAARATTALAFGTAAWIAAARGTAAHKSLYGYVVGLVAGIIGWAIVGAIEGMISMIVDSAFVCYSIDLVNAREGRSHCLEATKAFGIDTRPTGALRV